MTTISTASDGVIRSPSRVVVGTLFAPRGILSSIVLAVALAVAIGAAATESRTVALLVPPAIVALAIVNRRRAPQPAAPALAKVTNDPDRLDAAGVAEQIAEFETRNHEARAEISRLSAENKRRRRSADALVAAVPIVQSLSKTVARMSANGSTELTEDVYFLGDQSRRLNEQIAEQLRGMCEGDHSLEGCAQTLRSDIANLQRVSELCVSTNEALAESIASITKGIHKTHQLASAVMDIADRIGVVAINAAIYAGRAGTLGAGFSVIAREIQELATNARKTTDAIDNHVTGIQSRIGEFRDIHIESMKESEVKLTDTVSSLAQTTHDIGPRIRSARESINATGAVNEAVSDRLEKINVVMQQHDKIQQIVGHIPDIVKTTIDTIEGATPEELPDGDGEIVELVREIARSTFTMDDEYRAIGLSPPERSAGTAMVDGAELAGDVTLF